MGLRVQGTLVRSRGTRDRSPRGGSAMPPTAPPNGVAEMATDLSAFDDSLPVEVLFCVGLSAFGVADAHRTSRSTIGKAPAALHLLAHTL